ncbi:MAG: histidinol phosphate phosphatase [Crocinitomicaceae bacterium]|nr:histidinol phosphate phosphatase [Crocinitomicaceae bacterium]
MERRKAVFLDRDGVINHDPGDYTRSLDVFDVLPTVYQALEQLQDAGYLLILITNQGGIAKGQYTHETVNAIHQYFIQSCAERGIVITNAYYSPHHPDFGESLSRKPGGLMMERACARYGIDPSKSWMVGDKTRDITAGENAGIRGILMPVNGDLIDYVPQMISPHV